MSNKYDAIKKAIFYAHENPAELADIINGTVSDVVTSVTLIGADSIEVPADTSVTETYSSKVFSQFGDEMQGQSVTYSLKASVTGVSISGAVVTVAKTAVAESFTVVATCSGKTAEKVVALVAGE